MRNKKQTRTCIGCSLKEDKKNLYRIVKTKTFENDLNQKENNVVFDGSQQYGGRGAYICSLDCLDKAIQRKFLQNRLKTNISNSEIEELKEAINERLARGR